MVNYRDTEKIQKRYTARKENLMEKKSQMVNMRYPVSLLERIDTYKESEGFETRTDAIRDLVRRSLEIYEDKK
jgi:metal-responsive CopG/Arc/MetJ family transcriptional regulator